MNTLMTPIFRKKLTFTLLFFAKWAHISKILSAVQRIIILEWKLMGQCNCQKNGSKMISFKQTALHKKLKYRFHLCLIWKHLILNSFILFSYLNQTQS